MNGEKKEAAAVEGVCGKRHKITLIENDGYWLTREWKLTGGLSRPCAMCGNKTEPCGFDFFLSESTDQFVCKDCATEYAPELIPIQEQALFYVQLVTDRAKLDLRRDIRKQIMQAIEART